MRKSESKSVTQKPARHQRQARPAKNLVAAIRPVQGQIPFNLDIEDHGLTPDPPVQDDSAEKLGSIIQVTI